MTVTTSGKMMSRSKGNKTEKQSAKLFSFIVNEIGMSEIFHFLDYENIFYRRMSNKRRQTSDRQPLITSSGPVLRGPVLVRYDTSTLESERAIQQEKAEEIIALEGDLAEARDLMKLVADQVREQQGGLNAVSANTDAAKENVLDGTEELREARAHQRKARKKMCCLACILIVIVVVVIMVFTAMKK